MEAMKKKKKRLSLGGALKADKTVNFSGDSSVHFSNNDEMEKKDSMERRKSLKPSRKSLVRTPLSMLQFNEQEALDALDAEAGQAGPGGATPALGDVDRASRRKSMGRSLGAPAQPALSEPQLSDLYSECIKLATANKVNQKNAWSLHLIDYMEAVIMNATNATEASEADAHAAAAKSSKSSKSNNSNTKQEMNFQKASCTLDASVMIYSHRVDSVHKDTFKVLGSFSRSGGQQAGPAGLDEEGHEKKKRKRNFVSTIETNMKNINVKMFDLESTTDPLFKKMSASFDAGGAQGLLMNNLGVHDACTMAFDSDIVPDGKYDLYFDGDEEAEEKLHASRQAHAKEGQRAAAEVHKQLDLSELWSQLGDANRIQSMELCPTLSDLYDMMEGQELDDGPGKHEEDSYSDSESESDGDPFPSSQDMEEELMQGSEEQFGGLSQLDRAIEEEEQLFMDLQQSQPDDMQDDDDVELDLFPAALVACPASFSPGGGMDEEDMTAEGQLRVPLVFADQKDDFDFMDPALLQNWAGAMHWKFQKPASAASDRGGGGGGRAPRKQKAVFSIDFLDQTAVPEIAFAAPKRESNTLAKATLKNADPSKYVLQEDLQLGPRVLQQLCLRPHLSVGQGARASLQRRRAGHAPLSPIEGFAALADQDSDDEDAAGEGMDVGGFDVEALEAMMDVDGGEGVLGAEGCGEEGEDGASSLLGRDLELVAAPAKVEKVDINFAKFAKKVDVKQLKSGMWRGLQLSSGPGEGSKEDQEEKEKEADTPSFQSAIDTLPKSLPDKALSAVSVSYAFICLLHLCNEKNLRLAKRPLDVEDPQSTSDQSPNDAGYNLADFDIYQN